MNTNRSPGQQRTTHPIRGTSGVTIMLGSFAALALAACGDDPIAPRPMDQMSRAAAALEAPASTQHRPFELSQWWEPSGIDYTNVCVAEIPNPVVPGSSIAVPFGTLHGSGTATHWGLHTFELRTTYCSWNAEAGALELRGPWEVVVANGDRAWGTYAALGMLGPAGGDFAGSVLIQGGTGRFEGAYGEASLTTHDEPDGSGWSRGSGWIVY